MIISNLKKEFPNGVKAVQGVNLKIYNGQILALLGHNGAGKTTTLNMLVGLLKPSSGNAYIFNKDIVNNMDEIR